MFKDYYKILDLKSDVSLTEIKQAYKKKALKWHPDKNKDIDTTKQMQDVNEAYLILKDAEARIRYNQEYEHFVKYKDEDHINPKSEYSTNQESYDYEDYEFEDEILKYWVKNAQRQAKTYVKEITSLSANATKAAGTEMLQWFLGYLILGIIITIIFLLINNF